MLEKSNALEGLPTLIIIFTGGLAKLVAWAGLAYGAWTCYKAEL